MGRINIARRVAGRLLSRSGSGRGIRKIAGDTGKAVGDMMEAAQDLYDSIIEVINSIGAPPDAKQEARDAAQGLMDLAVGAYDYAMSSIANDGQATIVEMIGPSNWAAIAWNGYQEAGDDVMSLPHVDLVDSIIAELQDAGQGYRDIIDHHIGA